MEKLLLLFSQGAKVHSFIYKLVPNHYQYKEGTIRLAKRQGVAYEFDISDMVDWFLYFGFEEEGRLNLEKLNKSGNVFYDIGANIGDISLKAAKQVGEKGRVIAFEPDTKNFNKLKRNLDLNSFQNIQLNKLGLGDEHGEFKLYNVDPQNKGMNRVLKGDHKDLDYELIKIFSLDDFILEFNLPKPDFIKIDVEGFEHKVLNGSIKTLQQYKPILFIEISEKNLASNDSSPTQIFSLLTSMGYLIYNAHNMKEIDLKQDFTNCHLDAVAIEQSVM